jgi:putative methyltransferase
LTWSTAEAIASFTSRGFSISSPFDSGRVPLRFDLGSLSNIFNRTGFATDEHIPDLLLFAPQTTFHDDPSYKTGKVILQDKASCFPAVVLAPPARDDGFVIDATAAPGNKTSHLSALMKNKGKVSRQAAIILSI